MLEIVAIRDDAADLRDRFCEVPAALALLQRLGVTQRDDRVVREDAEEPNLFRTELATGPIDERQHAEGLTARHERDTDGRPALAGGQQLLVPFRQRHVRIGEDVRAPEDPPKDESASGRAASGRQPLAEDGIAAHARGRDAHESTLDGIETEHARAHATEEIEHGRRDAMGRLHDVGGADELTTKILERLRHRLGALALGDVARGQHDATDVGVSQQVGTDNVQPDPLTVGVTHAQLDVLRPVRTPEHARERRPRDLAILRMDQRDALGSERLIVVAEDPLERRAHVPN